MPVVSVILPTFDRLQYLQPAIESVLAQTFPDWELIVTDDGSGPEVRSYLSTLESDPRIRVIRLAHLGNPGAVRNVALQEARGEYVAFLDSDDLWMPAKLEVQLASLRARPEREWGYTEFTRIDHAGHSIDSQRNPHRVLHDGPVFELLLRLRVGIAMPTVMARRNLVERAGAFDEEQGLHEDYELWLRLARLSEVGVVARPLACVRRHAHHFSSGGVRTFEARRRVLRKMEGFVTSARERAILRAERSRNDTWLAFANAAAGDHKAMWKTLAGSWPGSWQSFAWYMGSARAVVRSFVPAWLVSAVRRRRSEQRAAVRA